MLINFSLQTQLPTAKRSSRTSAAYLSFRRRAYRTTKAKTISSQDQALIDNHPRSRSVVSVMQRVGSEKKSRVITKNQYRIKKRITRSSGPHLESIKSEFFDETLRPSGIESPKRQKIVMIPNVESTIANRSCSANGNDIRCGALCQCDEQTKSDETATSFWPKRNSIQ